MLEDTIAAISTPLGEAGLAVVRLSGPKAIQMANAWFEPIGRESLKPVEAPSHTLHYGKIQRDGRVIDEVMLAILRAPRTFTREDMVEITCHGGILVTKLVLDVVLAHGARLAQPGEFTKRAFINGRIDLTQAEAVADLIHSRTELSLAAAHEQLAGKLSARIQILRNDLLSILAHVEAHIDFPEEDIAPATKDQLALKIENALTFMRELLATSREGQILRRGIRVAIVGKPNAGKSSLLNQLLGHDRAIVSPIAGTTRDTIEETANIRGIPVVFIDTAGLRHSHDPIEKEGFRRSKQTMVQAELILHVFDQSEPDSVADNDSLADFGSKPRLLILNKTDLPARLTLPENTQHLTIPVCCTTGTGIEALKDKIKETVWSGDIKNEMLDVMINSRHQEALERATHAAENTLSTLRDNVPLELTAMELRIAVNAVGEIVGQTTTEDLLDTIFSQFCIGK
jgi:tRNA modification GTPase